MANRGRRPKNNVDDIPEKPVISKKELEDLEDETLAKVAKSISVLEVAIAKWNAEKEKPEYLECRYKQYEWFHTALSEWATKMLKAKKSTDVRKRLVLLSEFVKICRAYRQV